MLFLACLLIAPAMDFIPVFIFLSIARATLLALAAEALVPAFINGAKP